MILDEALRIESRLFTASAVSIQGKINIELFFIFFFASIFEIRLSRTFISSEFLILPIDIPIILEDITFSKSTSVKFVENELILGTKYFPAFRSKGMWDETIFLAFDLSS